MHGCDSYADKPNFSEIADSRVDIIKYRKLSQHVVQHLGPGWHVTASSGFAVHVHTGETSPERTVMQFENRKEWPTGKLFV